MSECFIDGKHIECDFARRFQDSVLKCPVFICKEKDRQKILGYNENELLIVTSIIDGTKGGIIVEKVETYEQCLEKLKGM